MRMKTAPLIPLQSNPPVEESEVDVEGREPVEASDHDAKDPEAELKAEQTFVSTVVQVSQESFNGVGDSETEDEEEEAVVGASEEGEEAAEDGEPVKVNDQECFGGHSDSEAEEEEEVQHMSETSQEGVKGGELLRVNDQQDTLVDGGYLEGDEQEAEGEEGVEGSEPVEASDHECLVGGLYSKDEEINMAVWDSFEDGEDHLPDQGSVEDEECSLAEWGTAEHEQNSLEQVGDATEECEGAGKGDKSVDVFNGDNGELADRGDAIVGGEPGYGEEEVKAKVHHEVLKECPKLKEFEVFVGGLSSDSTEPDLVKVLDVKVINETFFFMDPVTKNNQGFAFVQTEAELGKVLNGFAFRQFPTDAQAKLGLSVLKEPLVNGMPCGVAPSQGREPDEEIIAQAESSALCIPALGSEASPVQTMSGCDMHWLYTMPGATESMILSHEQSSMSFLPTLVDHGAIAGGFHQAQTDSREVYWPHQAMPVAIDMMSPSTGLCVQPQYSEANLIGYWPASEFPS